MRALREPQCGVSGRWLGVRCLPADAAWLDLPPGSLSITLALGPVGPLLATVVWQRSFSGCGGCPRRARMESQPSVAILTPPHIHLLCDPTPKKTVHLSGHWFHLRGDNNYTYLPGLWGRWGLQKYSAEGSHCYQSFDQIFIELLLCPVLEIKARTAWCGAGVGFVDCFSREGGSGLGPHGPRATS